MSFGIALTALTLAATLGVCGWRVWRVLFRENVDGRVLWEGLEPLLRAGDHEAVRAACAVLPEIAIAEVIRAGVDAAPAGREAVERAVDEAQLDWLPLRETGPGLLGTMARVCGAVGMLAAAVEIRTSLAAEPGALALGRVVAVLGGAILGLVVALYGRALVVRTTARLVNETQRAAQKLTELSSASNDSM